jgi:hypothetical protein
VKNFPTSFSKAVCSAVLPGVCRVFCYSARCMSCILLFCQMYVMCSAILPDVCHVFCYSAIDCVSRSLHSQFPLFFPIPFHSLFPIPFSRPSFQSFFFLSNNDSFMRRCEDNGESRLFPSSIRQICRDEVYLNLTKNGCCRTV